MMSRLLYGVDRVLLPSDRLVFSFCRAGLWFGRVVLVWMGLQQLVKGSALFLLL